MQELIRTKEELDARLVRVVAPAPLIVVGPAFPISTFAGYDDPQPGYYLGARVVVAGELQDACRVQEATEE